MAVSPASPSQTENHSDTSVVHQPYIPDSAQIPEFTWSAVLVGTILGIIFGASSLYLVLKVGMTVSASIPVAVMSITLFRGLSRAFGIRRATILENNIVQTTGSAGESIAFGVGVTMPALLLLGFEMEPFRVLMVSVLGGVLGILMMIPLRRAFIVKRHHELKYPEGTACADVLIVGEKGGANAKTVFIGFGLAFVYQFFLLGLKFWKETPEKAISWFKGAVASMEVNPTLLGVGYIIGPRVSSIMLAGGLLAYFVFVPAIHFFGDTLPVPLPPGEKLIADMGPDDMRNAYVLYIGAGAVAAGGIISLCRAMPLIIGSIIAGVRDLRAEATRGLSAVRRTDRDLSMRFVAVGLLGLVLVLTVFFWAMLPREAVSGWGGLLVNLVGALLIVLFGFLFVTVSSRLTGEIGSSSNPISGMTVATLLLTCLIFLVLGWTNPEHRLTAISIAAVVCIASSNGGTTSQDLKTGFLVGATPRYQQWSIIVGSVSSALVIGWILVVLNSASTVYTTKHLPAQKAAVDVARLSATESVTGDPATYHVWYAQANNPQGVDPGKYLVDDGGQIRYYVDPGINGRIDRRDDGAEVRKYSAPQARLMSLITDGILTQKLPWTLVLLGVFIAIVLELSQVPSLPFAVGVYLPLSLSTPVFVGGLLRYVADLFGPRPAGAKQSESEAEMTPGALLSTGYIAGGAIGGVLIAFLAFSEDIPRLLSAWQYRHYTLTESMPVEATYRWAARQEVVVTLSDAKRDPDATLEKLKRLAADIEDLNSDLIPRYTPVPAGTVLQLPGNETYQVPSDTTLGEAAEQALGSERQASTLLDLNKDKLKPLEVFPAGTAIKVPQKNWPALVAFSVLVVVLLAVSLGWFLQPPPAPQGEATTESATERPKL